MTIWEELFGTPERTARTLPEVVLDSQDWCFLMDALSDDREAKCKNCMYECDGHSRELKGMTVLEWLNQEVDA